MAGPLPRLLDRRAGPSRHSHPKKPGEKDMSTTTLEPVLQIRRVFAASPEELFDAWFTREQWQAWIGPEGCQCDVPLLEAWKGGRYRIQMHLSDGREIPVEGEFQV